jgi:predicted PurR-regulated permease PerM
MTHLIYIYLIINSFIVGYQYNDRYRFESWSYLAVTSFFLFFFGAILLPLYFLVDPIARSIGYIYKEVTFQYRFNFTDYWDKILLDDNYSEKYKTLSEKLKRAQLMVKNGSKQLKRHNKQVQDKYGKY